MQVQIFGKNLTEFRQFDFDIVFDSLAVKPLKGETGALTQGFIAPGTGQAQQDTFTFGAASLFGSASGSGHIATVSFELLSGFEAKGETTLRLASISFGPSSTERTELKPDITVSVVTTGDGDQGEPTSGGDQEEPSTGADRFSLDLDSAVEDQGLTQLTGAIDGDTIQVQIFGKDFTEFRQFDFDIVFDPSVVKPLKGETGALTQGFIAPGEGQAQQDTFTFGGASLFASASGSGHVATISFELLAGFEAKGETTLRLASISFGPSSTERTELKPDVTVSVVTSGDGDQEEPTSGGDQEEPSTGADRFSLDLNSASGDQGLTQLAGAKDGDVVQIQVFGKDFTEFRQFELDIIFDPSVVKPLKGETGALTPGFIAPGEGQTHQDTLTFGAASLFGSASGSGHVATVSFELLAGFEAKGETTLRLAFISFGPSTTDRTELKPDITVSVVTTSGDGDQEEPSSGGDQEESSTGADRFSLDLDSTAGDQGLTQLAGAGDGDTIQVQVFGKDFAEFRQFELDIVFDPSVVKPLKGELGALTQGFIAPSPGQAQQDTFTFGGASLFTSASGSGHVATVSFELLAGFEARGETTLRLAFVSSGPSTTERTELRPNIAVSVDTSGSGDQQEEPTSGGDQEEPSTGADRFSLDLNSASGDQGLAQLAGAKDGDTIQVQVFGKDFAEFRQFELDIVFDPSVVKPLKGELGALTQGFIAPGPGQAQQDSFTFGGASLFTSASGSGHVATVSFELLAGFEARGETTLRLAFVSSGPSTTERTELRPNITVSVVTSGDGDQQEEPSSGTVQFSLDLDSASGDQGLTQLGAGDGDTVLVQIFSKDSTEFKQFDLDIIFDPSVVKPLKGEPGAFTQGFIAPSPGQTQQDTFSFGAANLLGVVSGRGHIATISFELLSGFEAKGETTLRLASISLELSSTERTELKPDIPVSVATSGDGDQEEPSSGGDQEEPSTGADRFSLDLDSTAGDQGLTQLAGAGDGDTIQVQVFGKDFAEFRQFELDIVFDPSVVKPLKGELGALTQGFIAPGPGQAQQDSFTFGGASLFTSASGSGHVATVSFELLAGFEARGETTLRLASISLESSSGDRTELKPNTTVRISAEEPPAISLSAEPDTIEADGSVISTIQAQIVDASGNLKSDDSTTVVSFSITAGEGNLAASEVTVSGGIATTTLTGATIGAVTVQASAAGLQSETVLVVSTLSLAIELMADPDTIEADGSVISTIQAQIVDASGNLKSDDSTTVVSFSITAGEGNLAASEVTVSGGIATTTLTGATIGAVTVQASAAGLQSETVLVVSTLSLAIELMADPDTIEASGSETSTIQAKILDLDGNLKSEDSTTVVSFSITAGEGNLAASEVTVSGGIATTALTGATAGTVVVQATVANTKEASVSVTVSSPSSDGDASSEPSPDFNGDGVVNFDDFVAFAKRFGAVEGAPNYDAKFDLDGNKQIEFSDFVIFAKNFGRRVAGRPTGLTRPAGRTK